VPDAVPCAGGEDPVAGGRAVAYSRFRFALTAALAAMAPLAGAPPVGAAEPTRVETLRIEPRAPAPASGAPAPYAALLSKPSGWGAGGPAVVVLWEEPGRDDLRDRVVAAALDEGAAVLELDAHGARGVAADNAFAPPPPAAHELLPDLFAALDALRRDARAGAEVAAVGYGAAGGGAALLAADEPAAAAHLGADGPRYAGSAALGPGRPALALGALPAAARDRAPPAPWLCRALTAALAPYAAEQADAVAGDCAAALAPPQGPDAADAPAFAARADAR
jgi:hypothetical protein